MTRTRNARIAGITFLLYIVSGLLRAPDVRTGVLLTLVQNFSALVLAVTLYAITRDVDPELALFGFACRMVEGVLGAMFIPMRLALEGVDLGSGRGLDAPAGFAELESDPDRDLLRRREHGTLLASPARPAGATRAGLDRRGGVGPPRRGASASARGSPDPTCHPADVDPDGALRDPAGALADREGSAAPAENRGS